MGGRSQLPGEARRRVGDVFTVLPTPPNVLLLLYGFTLGSNFGPTPKAVTQRIPGLSP
jgi:hypothetical protein